MIVVYPVIFTQTNDKNDTYLIEIPDLNGMTQGQGLSDAFLMARDYIGNALFDVPDDSFPEATSPADISPKKGVFSKDGKSFISLIDLDVDVYRRMAKSKAVRRNVSIPEYLNQAADKAHLNVSRVLQEALMERLGFPNMPI